MPLLPFALLESLISPAPDQARVAFLGAQPYAHRGLHGRGVVENSRAAFAAALQAGHGIELDVQLSRDTLPFVFHDDRLDRLTDEVGAVSEALGSDLEKIRLRGTSETIPPLDEILGQIAGQVPVLIELKRGPFPVGVGCLAIRRMLEGYRGPVAIMSFDPEVAHWFHVNTPRIVRGLVVTEGQATGLWPRLKGSVARSISLFRAKPDFLAYDIRDLGKSSFAARQRKRGLPVLTWTVRTPEQERVAVRAADEIIYETAQGQSA